MWAEANINGRLGGNRDQDACGEADAMADEDAARQVVVVGVDGSDESVAALRWAGRYGAATGATVRALHIWHYPTAAGLPPGMTPESVTAEVQEHQHSDLAEAIDKAHLDPAARVDPRIAYGHPAQVLIDESKSASLLVVGHRGLGGFTGMLTGSVSMQLVNHAACPVVVVRGIEPGQAPDRDPGTRGPA
jgi:nucleotide-binding universal stress UspA family protein